VLKINFVEAVPAELWNDNGSSNGSLYVGSFLSQRMPGGARVESTIYLQELGSFYQNATLKRLLLTTVEHGAGVPNFVFFENYAAASQN